MSVLNLENYCIPYRYKLHGHTTKQALSNVEPQKPGKYKQRGIRTDPSCL